MLKKILNPFILLSLFFILSACGGGGGGGAAGGGVGTGTVSNCSDTGTALKLMNITILEVTQEVLELGMTLLYNMFVQSAYARGATGDEYKGVIDTGIRATHGDLDGNMVAFTTGSDIGNLTMMQVIMVTELM